MMAQMVSELTIGSAERHQPGERHAARGLLSAEPDLVVNQWQTGKRVNATISNVLPRSFAAVRILLKLGLSLADITICLQARVRPACGVTAMAFLATLVLGGRGGSLIALLIFVALASAHSM